MDGVLCRPITWLNLVISRDVARPLDLTRGSPKSSTSLTRQIVDTRAVETIRYAWRRPLPRVGDGVAALADVRRLVLLSGRPERARRETERWLVRHKLRDYFSQIVLNDGDLPNASFKLLTIRERGSREHVDDDGRVAFLLATEANQTVFLISWLGNAVLPYPVGVRRVRNLVEAANLIRNGDQVST